MKQQVFARGTVSNRLVAVAVSLLLVLGICWPASQMQLAFADDAEEAPQVADVLPPDDSEQAEDEAVEAYAADDVAADADVEADEAAIALASDADDGIALASDEDADIFDITIVDVDDTNMTCSIRQMALKSGATAPEHLVIPSTVEYNGKTYTVTDIDGYSTGFLKNGKSAFKNVTSIEFPSTLTKMSEMSLRLTNLTELTIPGTIKNFKGNVQQCSSLKKIVFEEGVETIENFSTSGCSSLTEVSLPSTLTKFSKSDFARATSLTGVTLPDNLDLSDCTGLFSGCTALKEVTLPSGTSVLPSSAFNNCTSLTKVTANGTITEVPASAFNGCTSLTQIPDLSKVTRMGVYAFYNCTSLKSEVDLSSLNEIPDKAFSYTPVTVTKFSDGLTSIGTWAFISASVQANEGNTLTFPSTLTSIGSYAFWYGALPETVVLPDSATSVATCAFQGVTGVKEIKIGSGLTTITANAFSAEGLEKITVNNSEDAMSGTSNFPSGVEVVYLVPSVDAKDDKISNAADAMTLQEAVDAAKDGDTITLEKNVKLGKDLNVPAGKAITIASKDGETYTIIADKTAGVNNLIGAVEGSDLTLKNVNLYGRNLSGSTIDSAGKLTLASGSNVTFGEVSKENCGAVNVHGSYAELVIEDGATVEKNTVSANNSASVRVSDGAKVTIKGGSIQNNTYSETHDGLGTAGVLLDSGATGGMTGGTISGNTARRGAALKLTGTESSNRTTFEISGGTISNNTNTNGSTSMSSAGGAVYVSDNSSLTMTGGEISGNKGGNGGGVTVVDWKLQNDQGEYKTAFVMNGGTISGNSATNGGGIYSYSNGTELNAGTLSGNTASNMGGGIYVEGNSEHYSTAYMENAFVTGNTAAYNGYSYSGIGGGLWLCPTGDTSSYIKNGGVLNGNTADRAADDVASAQKFGENYQLTLANRILGGGKVQWYDDGKLYGSSPSSPYPQSDGDNRYDGSGDSRTVEGSNTNQALKSVVSDADLASAKAQASLFITGNTAAMGGGIAANGGVQIGEANPIKVTVSKVWKTDDGKQAADSVTIQLTRDGEAYGDTVTLSDENNWTYAWENLEGGYDWSVEEIDVPEGFQVTVTRAESQGLVEFTVTNDDIPTDAVTVKKEWKLDDGGKATDSVKVQLYKDGEAYGDPVELSAETGWTYTWEELEAGHAWTVQEADVPEGFTASVSGNAEDGFTITNDDKPNEPENPDTPSNPSNPGKSMPSTNDGTGQILAIVGLIACAAVVVAVVAFSRKAGKRTFNKLS